MHIFQVFLGLPYGPVWLKFALVQEQCTAFSLEESSSVSQTCLQISVHVKMGRAPLQELLKGSCSFLQWYLQPKTWAPRALCVGAHHMSSLLLSSFPPHQCWFTSSGLYVIHQKEKPRMNDFNSLRLTFRSSCFDIWSERVSSKHKAAAPVYCERAVLSSFSIYVPAYNMSSHMD